MSSVSQEIRDRVFAAADSLYASSENGEYPSIEEVRIASRAGMQNVVSAMKEWRKAQRTHVHIVKEPIPSDLMVVVHSAGETIWQTAQMLANASLVTATEAFEDEKQTLIDISNQQSQSYEELEYKYADALSDKEDLSEKLDNKTVIEDELRLKIKNLESNLAVYETRVEVAEGKFDQAKDTILSANKSLERAEKQLSEKTDELRMMNEKLILLEAKYLAEIESVKNTSAKYEAELESSKSQNAELRTDIALARSGEKSSDNERKRLEKEVSVANEQAATAREKAAQLLGRLEAVSQQIEKKGGSKR